MCIHKDYSGLNTIRIFLWNIYIFQLLNLDFTMGKTGGLELVKLTFHECEYTVEPYLA
jgi:hypothetical protein